MSEGAGMLTADLANPYRLPSYFGDPEAEYAALRERAIVVDRTARGRMRLTGEKSRDVLAGLVTNDIAALQPLRGLYAAALTPKGKIIIDLRVYARDTEIWIDGPPLAWDGWWQTVRKYINPRLARYEDLSTRFASLGVYGVAAASLLARAINIPASVLEALEPYAHVPLDGEGDGGLVARVPDAGVTGFELWIPSEALDAARQRIVAAGIEPAGAVTADLVRIEAGRPEWGIDMDEGTLVQEANMDELQAISYTKGCYTGQETVARVHFRGHVNRSLRGLLLPDSGAELPARGTELLASDGKSVGDVRSRARSPRHGGIALAMIRREVASGDSVSVAGLEGSARVVELPFD
ncbi:MAG: glycine cleavage T C-terminal barrel domain-containing protein [Gemmatimonadaceae bacterium]